LREKAWKKAHKDYTGGILLLVFGFEDFFLSQPSHTKRILDFAQELRMIPFHADEVYLLLHPPDRAKEYFESPIIAIKA
jgi:hypothetical protein